MKKKQEVEQVKPVNKRNIDELFKEIMPSSHVYDDPRLKAIARKRDARESLLSKDRELIMLQEAYDDLREEIQEKNDSLRAAIREVRQEYWVKGLTLDVQKKIEELLTKVRGK